MSFQAMTWAISQKLPTRDKFVLLILANYASNERGDCYPSINRLCDDTGMTRNTVIEAIKALEEAGAVQVIRRTQDGVNLPNVYRLNLAWGSSAFAPPTQPGGSAAIEPPVQDLTGGSAPIAPEPINEPINKKKKKEERARVRVDPVHDGLVVDDKLIEEWSAAFPAIDVTVEVKRAEMWLKANPANRKSNYERFLFNWLTRAQDRAPRIAAAPMPYSAARRMAAPAMSKEERDAEAMRLLGFADTTVIDAEGP